MTQTEAVLQDVELYLDLYRRMRLIRGFEDLVQSLFLRGRGLRDDAPVLGPGGGRGRLREPARGP